MNDHWMTVAPPAYVLLAAQIGYKPPPAAKRKAGAGNKAGGFRPSSDEEFDELLGLMGTGVF